MRILPLFFAIFVTLGVAADVHADSPALLLRDGDRVVMLGNTLIERDRHYGQIETMLRSRFPGVEFSLRNLAWPGDTTTVQLRPLNYGSLAQHLAAAKPTHAIFSFGGAEAFAGPEGLAKFIKGYEQLLDAAERAGAKIIIVSPTPYEATRAPQPAISDLSDRIRLYADAAKKLAQQRGAVYVDLLSALEKTPGPLTDNGVHLTMQGYRAAAEAMAGALALPAAKLDESRREQVRRMVVEKETLWFYRYRAHNAEYIFGRRSEKKGGNAGNPTFPEEFAEFERQISDIERQLSSIGR